MKSELLPQIDPHPEQQRSENSDQISPFRSLATLVAIECAFTVTGGFLDAYAFIAHDHVFANAQTGNVVYFAVYATEGNWTEAVRHVPPILAFICGVTAAKLLGSRSHKRTYRATLQCQCIELVVLSLLALFVSRLPNAIVVPVISFVAALQITSFDALGPWSFNSAMTTGNLKSAVVGSFLWLRGYEPDKNRGKAIVSWVACLSFLFGALFGGFYTRRHASHALVPCIVLVFLGFVLTWYKHRTASTSFCESVPGGPALHG